MAGPRAEDLLTHNVAAERGAQLLQRDHVLPLLLLIEPSDLIECLAQRRRGAASAIAQQGVADHVERRTLLI
jgi:hypothetical protein